MLYFIQQFWIRAEIMRKMLYFVQDFLNTPDFHHDWQISTIISISPSQSQDLHYYQRLK